MDQYYAGSTRHRSIPCQNALYDAIKPKRICGVASRKIVTSIMID
jgi:hypothetical protein